MAVSATPSKYDPKVLFENALSTTLTTTLVTGASARGTRIFNFTICNTGTTLRAITIDYKKGATARKLLSARSLEGGETLDVLAILGGVMFIDSGDLIRGGQAVGTDVDCLICGVEMDT